jgi:hypothetical protein
MCGLKPATPAGKQISKEEGNYSLTPSSFNVEAFLAGAVRKKKTSQQFTVLLLPYCG